MTTAEPFRYASAEMTRALSGHPEDEPLRIKVVGERGETRWLNISLDAAQRIADIIDGDDPTDMSDADHPLTLAERNLS